MIKEAYVSFETAKLLKEKGFDEKVSTHYLVHPSGFSEFFDKKDEFPEPEDVWLKCPTHQMAMKWLREEYNIYISIQPDFPSEIGYKMCWCWSANILHENCISTKRHQCYIETYEEACEAAIKYCLEYLI